MLSIFCLVLNSASAGETSQHSVDSEVFAESQIQDGSASIPEPIKPLHAAWEQGRQMGKPVMLVLGSKECDRCALLSHYLMGDSGFRQRVNDSFVLHRLDVGSPESMIEIEEGNDLLPIVLLLDSAQSFDSLMQSNNVLTFLPEPQEPIFDWFENVLIYTEQNFAAL